MEGTLQVSQRGDAILPLKLLCTVAAAADGADSLIRPLFPPSPSMDRLQIHPVEIMHKEWIHSTHFAVAQK
jgi:hypothetical protein